MVPQDLTPEGDTLGCMARLGVPKMVTTRGDGGGSYPVAPGPLHAPTHLKSLRL